MQEEEEHWKFFSHKENKECNNLQRTRRKDNKLYSFHNRNGQQQLKPYEQPTTTSTLLLSFQTWNAFQETQSRQSGILWQIQSHEAGQSENSKTLQATFLKILKSSHLQKFSHSKEQWARQSPSQRDKSSFRAGHGNSPIQVSLSGLKAKFIPQHGWV